MFTFINMEPAIGKIYKITCTVTNLSYIGKTIQSLQKRFNQHFSKKSTCRILKDVINEHGRDNFYIETIWEGGVGLLGKMEKKMIKEFNTLYPNGYNLREGGGRDEKACNNSRQMMISKQREISLRKNGLLGSIKENKSKLDGRTTSWALVICREGKEYRVAKCSNRDEILKVQEEYTKDPDGYTIPPSVRLGNGYAKGVYYSPTKQKWMVNFTKYLGTYDTEEEANDVLNKFKEDPDSFTFVKLEREHVGVTYNKNEDKWSSTIFVNKKKVFLGYYITKEEAICARKSFIEDPESFVRPNQRKKIKL